MVVGENCCQGARALTLSPKGHGTLRQTALTMTLSRRGQAQPRRHGNDQK